MTFKTTLAACLTSVLALTAPLAASAQGAPRLTVMTYNVENFFDAVDDPRMPNADSAEVINTEAWVQAKASAVARVIQRFDFGKGPDVLVLSEVESQQAMDAIKAALPDAGAAYVTAVLVDADPNRPDPKPDRRGIKVAVLSKLAMASQAVSFPVDLTKEPSCLSRDGAPGTTRDILQVNLALPDGGELTVFAGHLPSGGNPLVCREIAAKTLVARASTLPANRLVIAAGDFNFNCAPAERKGLHNALAGWVIPQDLENGCRGNGSQFYYKEKTWSYLDVIAERPSKSNWTLDPQTFRTVLVDFEQFFWDERDQVMRPKAFRLNTTTGKASGTSDHWPVAVDVVGRP